MHISCFMFIYTKCIPVIERVQHQITNCKVIKFHQILLVTGDSLLAYLLCSMLHSFIKGLSTTF